LVDAQLLPRGRTQAGDHHLKFYETRDNLPLWNPTDPAANTRAAAAHTEVDAVAR